MGSLKRLTHDAGTRARRSLAAALAPVMAAGLLAPVGTAVLGGAGLAAASIAVSAAPAGAATSETTLVVQTAQGTETLVIQGAAAPLSSAGNWWDYYGYSYPSRLSEDVYYNFSVKMSGDMEKAAVKLGKKLGKVAPYLAVLSQIIHLAVHNLATVAAIVALVSAVLTLLDKNVKKWIKIIKKYFGSGGGKHAGFYSEEFESLLGVSYVKSADRRCLSKAYNCGGGGAPHK